MPTGNSVQGNHPLAVIALDIELAQILRVRALVVRDFQNDLVLIGRLFDQVAIVLGIRVMQQRENPGFGHPVQLCLVTQNVNLQAGRVIVEIRIHKQEAGILVHLRDHLAGGRINLVRIDPGHRVGELPLDIGGRSGTDLKRRIWLHKGNSAGNGHGDPAHQLSRDLCDRRPLRRVLQKGNQEGLV